MKISSIDAADMASINKINNSKMIWCEEIGKPIHGLVHL